MATTQPNARTTVAEVRAFGTPALLVYEAIGDEVQRRQRCGLGAVADHELLDVLLGLPLDLPVHPADLSDRECRVLRRAPSAAVEVSGAAVVRRVTAPLVARSAVVSVKDWRRGLRKAGQFAPFCARSIALSTRPADLNDAMAQARFYGIGILCGPANHRVELLAAEAYVRHRHSSGQWWFAEDIYRQVQPTT
jgi:hypothetical protein